MAFFLFIDESGHDHHDSPYEVLAGIAIEDKDLWSFVQLAHQLEIACFGRTYREDGGGPFLHQKDLRWRNGH
jgi:hypothetical protein